MDELVKFIARLLDGDGMSGHRKINLSQVFASQTVGITQVDAIFWLASFMNLDLGCFEDETCRPELIANPSEQRCHHVSGTNCHLCVRNGPAFCWRPRLDSNQRPSD